MLPTNNIPSICPYPSTSATPTSSTTVLDTSKATGAISPATTSSIKQLSSHSTSSDSPSSPVITSRIYPDETPPTQAQIDIVRYSWERVSEIRLPSDDPNVSSSHAFGLAFYDALFDLDPSVKPLFSNIFQQSRALAGMVSYIARVPNITTTNNNLLDENNICGFAMNTSSSKDKLGRRLTIREINARKRKESTASTFSELVTDTAAAAASNNNKNNCLTQQSTNDDDDNIEADPEQLLHKLRELGAKHYFYQVQPHHFALIGPAVLKAIKVRLGKEFLPEVAEAWTRAHAYAAFHMKIGLEAQASWESGRRKSTTVASKINANSKANCIIQ